MRGVSSGNTSMNGISNYTLIRHWILVLFGEGGVVVRI